jgi:aldehyde dehydrogenase (NAD+)
MTSVLDAFALGSPFRTGLLLGGEVVDGAGADLALRSRLDGSVLAQVASASADDVRAAYDRADAARGTWAAATPGDRADVLRRAAQLFRDRAPEIGAVISAEMGKPAGEARTEVTKGAAILDYFGQLGYRSTGTTHVTDTGEDVFTIAEPLGVVTLITPWNFPFTLPIRKIAAALATGNTVLFKPATNAALCGLAIGQTLIDAGLPADVLSVLVAQSSAIESALFSDTRLGGVSLTGSYPTAEAIRRLLPVHVPFQAELGGKNTLVIWKDADLDFAMQMIWQSSFRNNGQICTSCGRLLVHEDLAPALLERLRTEVTSRAAAAPEGEYGIMSSDREHAGIRSTLARADALVEEVISADWGEDRMAPTVLVAPPDGELTEEEIFGPVITYETVSTIEDAIAKGNSTPYGLTSGIVTNDLDTAKVFWLGIRSGLVKVNTPLTGTPFHIPLQGFGHSGVGPGEGGDVSIDFFTRRKAVYLRRASTS